MSDGAVIGRLLGLLREVEIPDLIHLATSEQQARTIARFLPATTPFRTLVYPAWDCLPYDRVLPSREAMGERMAVLSKLAQDGDGGRPRIVITTPEALLQRVPPRSALRTFELVAGAPLDPDRLRSFCDEAGFVLDERVDEVGEAVFRAEVIDIFPAGSPSPLRLEIRNGSIGAIRPYDALSQRTQGEIPSLLLGAVSELPPPHDTAEFEGAERRLANAFPQLETLFDYLPEARLVMEPRTLRRSATVLSNIFQSYQDRLDAAGTGSGTVEKPPEPGRLYLRDSEWNALVTERSISFGSTDLIKPIPSFATAARSGRAFADFLKEQLATGRRILLTGASKSILAKVQRRAERATDISPMPVGTWDAVFAAEKPSLLSIVAALDEGFVDEGAGIAVVAASDVLGSRIEAGGDDARAAAGHLQLDMPEFRLGDLMVHLDHGVGVLRGLERVDTPEGPQDSVRLAYADDAALLVPVDELDKVWRYGSEASAVSLDRLDGDAWVKRRTKIETILRRTARAMHASALKRSQSEAPKLVPPQSAYERFVARFPFSETPDQACAIEAVLNDLASGRPMDRLVVGDVGFGKTEIALRAAAATALAGKQVAVVVPTTVLARQHFDIFERRFAGLGVEVAHMSRLVGRKEAAAVKQRLADGSVRVVIGTHALTGKGAEFADLGLLVIDEEHRFGAAHKQKLRTLAAGVHVLTLTATPIPRTLQGALAGLQDVSRLASPPARRRPVRTVLAPFDLPTIGSALRREKRRGGQSFVVVPRIEDIEPVAAQLRMAAHDLDLKIAHGKLPAAEVDATMIAFSQGRGDVLLSTSIIESGLDVPAANTMIVLRADLFGLAELHQLRGRVGRNPLQAFCYLMTAEDKELPEAAEKRLNTMQAFDRLGAGLEIAARDLDLRGAGDLIGEDQAGHAALIGLGLYQELFARALGHARGEKRRQRGTEFQIATPGWVPEDYIPEAEIRLDLYHRAARASTPAEIDRLADEIADRFGPLPPPVIALLEVAAVRTLAASLKVRKISAGPKGISVTFAPGARPTARLVNGTSRGQDDLHWNGERLILRRTSATPEERLGLIRELLTRLE